MQASSRQMSAPQRILTTCPIRCGEAKRQNAHFFYYFNCFQILHFSKKKTICIDGDGSMLMHLGSMSLCNFYAKKNFKYILMNNNSHESVGGQTTNIKNTIQCLHLVKYKCKVRQQTMPAP